MRKNPENKPLEIKRIKSTYFQMDPKTYIMALSNLAIAESNLVRAGKDSAMPHFIAIVKEIEKVGQFKFQIMKD